MPDWTLHQWLIVVIAMMALIIALLAWLRPRHPKSDPSREIKRFEAYQAEELPIIHETNGVPTLSQLMAGIELDAKRLGIARRFYEFGLAQFNHYVNNRDWVIEESRRNMASLAGGLSQREMCLAESIGISLAANGDSEQIDAIQAQYRELSPQAQIYAQHKRHETGAMKSIARDLETNTPRTDYTSVKARIASGNVYLESIISELPILWQDIRTLDERAERPRVKGRPPKREFLHVMLVTRDRRLLEDKHAEKDGGWIVSNKHNIEVPYQAHMPILVHSGEGTPPVRKGEAVFITHDQGNEMRTEFWRKGGRLDQVYTRSKNGMAPEQLRSAYRWRLINRAAWVASVALLIVEIILLATFYV